MNLDDEIEKTEKRLKFLKMRRIMLNDLKKSEKAYSESIIESKWVLPIGYDDWSKPQWTLDRQP